MTEAVDVVVHCTRTADGPRVTEIVTVEDLAAAPDGTRFTLTEVFTSAGPDQPLAATGLVPVRAQRAFSFAGIDLPSLLGTTARTDRDGAPGR